MINRVEPNALRLMPVSYRTSDPPLPDGRYLLHDHPDQYGAVGHCTAVVWENGVATSIVPGRHGNPNLVVLDTTSVIRQFNFMLVVTDPQAAVGNRYTNDPRNLIAGMMPSPATQRRPQVAQRRPPQPPPAPVPFVLPPGNYCGLPADPTVAGVPAPATPGMPGRAAAPMSPVGSGSQSSIPGTPTAMPSMPASSVHQQDRVPQVESMEARAELDAFVVAHQHLSRPQLVAKWYDELGSHKK